MVRLYHSLGYSGIVITDHLHSYTFRTLKKTNENPTTEDKLEYFLKGYKAALKEAEKFDGFRVYLGAELRFDKNDNDYLLFGLNEDKLYKIVEMIESKPEKALKSIREMDIAVIQAHPFRDDCVVLKPGICDGIEVFNAHSADSRNDIALLWAEKFSFIMTSGSDFHGGGKPEAGIYIDELPSNENGLRDIILSGSFRLKTDGK